MGQGGAWAGVGAREQLEGYNTGQSPKTVGDGEGVQPGIYGGAELGTTAVI